MWMLVTISVVIEYIINKYVCVCVNLFPVSHSLVGPEVGQMGAVDGW